MTDLSAPRVTSAEGAQGPLYTDSAWCHSRYFDHGKTLREIAVEAGCGLRTVARWFKRHGIEIPASHEKRKQRGTNLGERNGNWKGGLPKCPSCGETKKYHAGVRMPVCWDCRNKRNRGSGNPKWRGDRVCYQAAHARVKAIHGSASTHTCRHCGGSAAHWAYDRTDPDEKFDPEEGPYSLDTSRYMTLCVSCHKRYDLAYIARHGRRTHAVDYDGGKRTLPPQPGEPEAPTPVL